MQYPVRIPLVECSSLRRIVFIGSTAAYEPYPAVPTYGIAKWALREYAANLRHELMSKIIGVTFLALGGTPNGHVGWRTDIFAILVAGQIFKTNPETHSELLIFSDMRQNTKELNIETNTGANIA